MVVNEFLPLFVGQPMIDEIQRSGRRFYGASVLPGQPRRRQRETVLRVPLDPALADDPDPGRPRRRMPAGRRFIGWQTFFDFGDGEVRPNKRIDATISTPLFTLPLSAIAGRNQPQVLPQRNLLRHVTWSMPSGQALAASMGAAPLTGGDLAELSVYGLELETNTPLWYYVLTEAELVPTD